MKGFTFLSSSPINAHMLYSNLIYVKYLVRLQFAYQIKRIKWQVCLSTITSFYNVNLQATNAFWKFNMDSQQMEGLNNK